MREAQAASRMSPHVLRRLLSEGTGPFERASVGVGGCPATIGGQAGARVATRDGIRRPERVDALSRACYSDIPVGTAPQGPPAAEGDSPASFGAVLQHTRHQHRLDWCVPGRSLKTE
jgi:hypothetical protein